MRCSEGEKRARRKFLTYAPWRGQLNNTRMCFEMALTLATISERILVLPSGYRLANEPEGSGDSFRPLHPREFLDFGSLDRVVELVEFKEYCDYIDRSKPHDIVDLSFEPGTTVFCFPSIPSSASNEAARLLAFAAGRLNRLELTRQMREWWHNSHNQS